MSDSCSCLNKCGEKKANKRRIIRLILSILLLGILLVLDHLSQASETILFYGYIVLYLFIGGDVLWEAITNDIIRNRAIDEHFLMSLATIGAFCMGECIEAVAVMLFYQIGIYFEDLAVGRSKKSIADLMDIRPDYANLKRDGNITRVSPEDVKIGDIIIVKAGEKIPLDGIVTDGTSTLDTKALTGETMPRKADAGTTVLSGCINQTGVLTIEVTKTFGESTAMKILDLVENAGSKKAKTENFITTFARYYTPIVVLLAAFVAFAPPLLFGGDWTLWISRSLIFLVISCPCALVVSIPLSFFSGIGKASSVGVLVKGGNYLEALGKVTTILFDKTGTLTKGTFNVTEILAANGFSKQEVIEVAAKAEFYSNHPIALSIKKEYGKKINQEEITENNEIAGKGLCTKVGDKTVLCGNEKLMQDNNIDFSDTKERGTKVYVSVNGKFAGIIVIADELKDDSKEAVSRLKQQGVSRTVMLTGDNAQTAEGIAEMLGIDEVYSGLLPKDKVEKLEMLIKEKSGKGKLAFVGDGINDAPVLAQADVGIAMGGLGSDAAIEAADVVIMTDEPSRLAEAIQIAKFTKRIAWQNIVIALGVKIACMLLGVIGAATLWEAVFADVGVTLLAVLNSMRIMKHQYPQTFS